MLVYQRVILIGEHLNFPWNRLIPWNESPLCSLTHQSLTILNQFLLGNSPFCPSFAFFSHGFTNIFPSFPRCFLGFPMFFPCFSHVFPMFFPTVFPPSRCARTTRPGRRCTARPPAARPRWSRRCWRRRSTWRRPPAAAPRRCTSRHPKVGDGWERCLWDVPSGND